MASLVQFDDALTLAGFPQDLASATAGFYFTGLGSWYELSAAKSEVRERPQAYGAFGIAQDWRTSLAISVQGAYVGQSRTDVQTAKNTLKGALGTGRPVVMRVTDADGTFTRAVSIRQVTPDDDHGGNTFTFTADMVATDPFMYGDPATQTAGVPASGGGLLFPLGTTPTAYWDFGVDGISGRVSVTNSGTAPTWPTIAVSGGLAGGFVVTDVTTNQVVRFERVIPDGSTVSINQRTGRASIDGASNDVSGFLTSRDFFQIPAGATHQIQFSPLGVVTGSPFLSLTSSPAYL